MQLSILILAIALIETGNNPRAVGRYGETEACQMTEMARSEDGTPARRLLRMERELPRHGIPVNPYTLALAWHCPQHAFAGRPTNSEVDYARRVRNLYDELSHENPAILLSTHPPLLRDDLDQALTR